jgi:hypothetical protein
MNTTKGLRSTVDIRHENGLRPWSVNRQPELKGDESPKAGRRQVAPAVPKPLATPAEQTAGNLQLDDDDIFDAPPVASNGVQGGPRRGPERVQPDGRPLALALGAEQAAAEDRGQQFVVAERAQRLIRRRRAEGFFARGVPFLT